MKDCPTDWQIALKPGDLVKIRMDDGREVVKCVKAAPWLLGHGAWLIGLVGISGGYWLMRVVEKMPVTEGATP